MGPGNMNKRFPSFGSGKHFISVDFSGIYDPARGVSRAGTKFELSRKNNTSLPNVYDGNAAFVDRNQSMN